MVVAAPVRSANHSNFETEPSRKSNTLLRYPKKIQHRYSVDSLEITRDLLRFADLFMIFLTGIISQKLYFSNIPDDVWMNHLRNIAAVTAAVPVVLHQCGLYRDESFRLTRGAIGSSLFGCITLALLGLLLGLAVGSADLGAWPWLTLWFAGSVSLLIGTRLILAKAIGNLISTGALSDRVAILGGGPLADRLVDHLATLHILNPARCPIEVVGIFDDRSSRLPANCGPVSGTVDDMIELGKAGTFNRVLLTLPWSAESRLLEIRNKLQALSIDVALCPDGIAFAIQPPRRSMFGDLPFYSIAQRPMRRWGAVAKRLEDIILALLALTLFGPMMGLIALAIKLDSTGPVLFRQRRHGFNNLEISVYKFRTMRTELADHSGGRQTQRDDNRITRVGGFLRRSSLDELPQLLNVLKGDMSLVGPRPHPVGMKTKDLLCHEIVDAYTHRHRVKPGITGWAQVNGFRGATTEPEHLIGRIEHDLFYIDHWSVLFDMKIIFKTVKCLITAENAF